MKNDHTFIVLRLQYLTTGLMFKLIVFTQKLGTKAAGEQSTSW